MDMAEVPAITLTDPNNHDQAPSPARSPEKSNINYGALGSKVVEPARPGTPNNNSKNGHGSLLGLPLCRRQTKECGELIVLSQPGPIQVDGHRRGDS